MTAKISSNASQVSIGFGNQPVANLPASCGVAFGKNKLLNGEVTRINQRAFDGNWTPKGNYPPAGTIAQKEATYGYDQWAKADATNMLQVIEAGNFRPSTVHTLSGQNVTTQQITSPASGNWTITVPQTARNVQLEEGTDATPFEIRPVAFELAQCQRYYCCSANLNDGNGFYGTATSGHVYRSYGRFPVSMRTTPTVVLSNVGGGGFPSTPGTPVIGILGYTEDRTASSSGNSAYFSTYTASAVM